MRFSWMFRNTPSLDYDQLLEFVQELDSVGYDSVLLTVDSRKPDYLPLVSAIMNKEFSIKYMLAMRPYLLSPQFFTMLIAGMQRIAKDKLIINWVHGVIYPGENFRGVLGLPSGMYNPDVRRGHMKKFLHALTKTTMFKPVEFPDFIISGSSEEVMEMAHEFGMHMGTGADAFVKNHEKYKKYNFKKLFVQVGILVRDTDEAAAEARKENPEDINVIYGSLDTVEKELIKLSSMGATDFLVSNSFNGGRQERERIHNLISLMKERGLAE